jgi:hypothetical protein
MDNTYLKKDLWGVVLLSGMAIFSYFNFEPCAVEAMGVMPSADTITVTQGVTSEVSISAPADVTMSPTIAGISGGTGDGSATWTVKCTDTSGFNMKIKASTSPALQTGSYNFADYTEASAGTPDFTWGINAADSEFGFTVEPATAADTVQAFKDNGSVCGGAGAANASDKCWDGLATTDIDIINRSSITSSSGEAEVVKFKAQSGASHFQAEGTYTATITVTAVTN